MHPLCSRMKQFAPLSCSSPKSRFSYEKERLIFDIVIYRHLTSVLHTQNTASSSACEQLKILYGFDPRLLLYFLYQPIQRSHEQSCWAFSDFRLVEVCRNILDVTCQRVYHKESLTENNKSVYFGNCFFSSFFSTTKMSTSCAAPMSN